MKLKIDFLTQTGNSITNDCGPAVIAMIAGVTIQKALTVTGKAGQQLHIADIMTALRAYRIDHEHKCPITLADARALLALGHPIIALVGYGNLPTHLKADTYNGNHYVILSGYTAAGFYVHDPLQPQGYALWPDEALGYAWSHPVNAMPLQGIVVRQTREIIEPSMDELGTAVAIAMNETAARHHLEKLLAAMGIGPGPLEERVGHALAWIALRK